MGPLVFESCHSTWIFDERRLRFRRVLKDIAVGEQPVVTQWRPYFGVEVDPLTEGFTVLLNPDGTRLLRSWRHTRDCTQCGGQATSELSLDALRCAIG